VTPGAPLYETDPAAWQAQMAEGNARQARKRVAADAILRDREGRLLLVDPGYRPGWDLPGGMAEANEPPHVAARRELMEELALDLPVGDLLCVEWVAPQGPWDDLLVFIFDGGELTAGQMRSLRLNDGELADFGFFPPEATPGMLGPDVRQRTKASLEALTTGRVRYLN